MVSGNSAPPRLATNYMHFIAPLRAVHGGTCVQFLATARVRSRCFVLVFRYRYTAGGGGRGRRAGARSGRRAKVWNLSRMRLDTPSHRHTHACTYAYTHARQLRRDHAGGATRSFRGLKNFTAGMIVVTRAASYTPRGFPSRPPSFAAPSSFLLSFSLVVSRPPFFLDSSRSRRTQVS